MADLAVGLSKTVVEGALARVKTAIQEEAKLRQKAQRDLALISLEFEMMHSFLSVANDEMSTNPHVANDEMSTTKNHLVRTWVRHVRELANDLEDGIELAVDLDDKPIFWRRMLPSCISPELPLDQAVVEIEELKGRAKELSECYMRYSHITDVSAGSKLVMLPQQPSSRATGAIASSVLSKARDAARRRQGLGDLTQLITTENNTEDPSLQVISVWGTGGDLGMTSVIRRAFNDPEVCQNFSCRVWVKLMHPFNPHEFVQRFMAQVYANGWEQPQGARLGVHVLKKLEANQEDLLEEFVEQVNTKTYLVVLDNLIDMIDWDAVRTFLPDMKNGSWIIVSTQQFEIASLCIGHSYQPLELKHFAPDHSVCAFLMQGSQVIGDKEEKRLLRVLSGSQVSKNSSSEEVPSSNRKAVVIEWQKKYPLVGRESEMAELRGHTARARFSTNSQVISVWGIAGIGKSALVRNLYYDRMLGTEQFNKYCWVDVSHPFNLRDFSRSLLSGSRSEKDPIKECREHLKRHNCLVVIDDLQSKQEWDLIQNALVSRPYRSVIIVITTEASIAAYCTNNEAQVFNVKGLEHDAARDLFRKEVHKKNPSSPLVHLTHLELDGLIFKCGGLPKVIVAIASLLAMHTVTLMDTVRSMNLNFMHHLETNLGYDSMQRLFSLMSTYLCDSPDSLKPCIFYQSIFPPYCNIRRRRLVRRWIAEGYSRDNGKKSAEEQGEEFFTKLLELSIIQQIPQLVTTATNDTTMVKCQVNGFIREYIASRGIEENLVFELGPNCVLTTQRPGRHLTILRDWDRDRNVFESIDFSRLRSMTVYGKWESFFISKSMRLLQVLDLEDAVGVNDDDVQKMVKRLRRLKFLSLRGCSEIFHLPSSLVNLRQLQSLDVRHTSIVTLPENITKLKKLQYIRVGTTVPASTPSASYNWLQGFRRQLVGVKVPTEIGKLTLLHTLGVVNIRASGEKAIVKEIKKLMQLRKLGVSGVNRHNSKEFFSSISGHVNLESLLVRLDKENQGCFDGISLDWENLQSLKLYGLHDKLPLSGSHLWNLRKLYLEMATLEQSDVAFIGTRLPKLCILRLHVQKLLDDKLHLSAEMVGCELITYEKVKILDISYSSGSLHVTFGSKSMKNLELLKIDCSSACYRLTGVDDLPELKQILLKGTMDETIKTALETQLANHPNKPAVNLEELPQSS